MRQNRQAQSKTEFNFIVYVRQEKRYQTFLYLPIEKVLILLLKYKMSSCFFFQGQQLSDTEKNDNLSSYHHKLNADFYFAINVKNNNIYSRGENVGGSFIFVSSKR